MQLLFVSVCKYSIISELNSLNWKYFKWEGNNFQGRPMSSPTFLNGFSVFVEPMEMESIEMEPMEPTPSSSISVTFAEEVLKIIS